MRLCLAESTGRKLAATPASGGSRVGNRAHGVISSDALHKVVPWRPHALTRAGKACFLMQDMPHSCRINSTLRLVCFLREEQSTAGPGMVRR